jgi:hypothetical protein
MVDPKVALPSVQVLMVKVVLQFGVMFPDVVYSSRYS